MKQIVIPLLAFLLLVSCRQEAEQKANLERNIPTLEKLSGKWVSVDTVDMEPSLRNFRAQALTNKDMTSLNVRVS